MKSIYLLPCIVFINLSAMDTEFPLGFDFWDDNPGSLYLYNIKTETPVVKSRYCSELNCWSLKECLLHNKRLIFFNHMLQKSKTKKVKVAREVSSILLMLPQTLRHLIGSYAQETPTRYKIKSYEAIRQTSYLEDRVTLDNTGILSMDSTDQAVVLESTLKKFPKIVIALSPIEADFFKSTLDGGVTFPHHVTWQHTGGENIALLMKNKEDFRALTQDKLFLKPSSDYNKGLKAAGLLPKKRKQL